MTDRSSSVIEPHPYSGRPYYCAHCGMGYREFVACEEVMCRLETVEKAEARKKLYDEKQKEIKDMGKKKKVEEQDRKDHLAALLIRVTEAHGIDLFERLKDTTKALESLLKDVAPSMVADKDMKDAFFTFVTVVAESKALIKEVEKEAED